MCVRQSKLLFWSVCKTAAIVVLWSRDKRRPGVRLHTAAVRTRQRQYLLLIIHTRRRGFYLASGTSNKTRISRRSFYGRATRTLAPPPQTTRRGSGEISYKSYRDWNRTLESRRGTLQVGSVRNLEIIERNKKKKKTCRDRNVLY